MTMLLILCYIQVKMNATQNIFTQSATRIVQAVLAATGMQAPLASLPKPANMTRIVNRVRRNLRPQDPKDLDFMVS